MKPDIIFIHGMWSRHTVWSQWQAAFQDQGFNCFALDLPGHAEHGSDMLLAKATLDSYVAALVKAVDSYHRPIVIGHSLGGLIGQLGAERLKLSGLVLVNSAAPGQVFPLRPVMFPGLTRHFLKWGLWRKTFRLSAWEANYLIFNRVPREQRADCHKLLIAESGKVAYEVGFGLLNLAGSNRVYKDRINCPMLALAGGKDRIIPRSVSRGMARWYGMQLEYHEYPSQGHWLLGETGWEGHVETILNWIHELDHAKELKEALTSQNASLQTINSAAD